MVLESSEGLLEEIGVQALATGAYSPPEAVAKSIDSVTSNDVIKVPIYVLYIFSAIFHVE